MTSGFLSAAAPDLGRGVLLSATPAPRTTSAVREP